MSQIISTNPIKPTTTEYLSKYRNSRMYYLEEHCPDLYNEYIQSGELRQHCLEVQRIADNR
ncbi:MAG: TnpV protein, partial [Defluviitaleaceae bacterium]|nr:TnpV protein [Defluviitaleaceae bacterium]